jgi:hypothetical protein
MNGTFMCFRSGVWNESRFESIKYYIAADIWNYHDLIPILKYKISLE